tara:strand:+ start:39 stop:338 length:300 start_codon:yes stop_codon:yes gene_type:complete
MNKNNKIKNLSDKINKLQDYEKKIPTENKNKDGISFGFRIGVEIVAAILVGVVIGIYVDKYLGTKPFGLIIFFIFGSLAGFLNIYRVMRRIEKNNKKLD